MSGQKEAPMISADAIRGYIDLIVLSLLQRQPSYAYEIAKTISEVSEEAYSIKQTTLYTALKRLEASGLTESFTDVSGIGKTRTYYRLTPLGATHLSDKLAEWEDTKNLVDRFASPRKGRP